MKRVSLQFIIVLCASALCALPAESPPPKVPQVVLDGSPPVISALAFFRDTDRNLGADGAMARFLGGDFELRPQTRLDNYGFGTDVLWFAFVVNNTTGRGSETMLQVEESNLHDVRVYINRASYAPATPWSESRSGVVVPVSRRQVPVVPLLFSSSMPPATVSLILIRIDNPGPNRLHFSLDTSARMMGSMMGASVLWTGCLGVLFVLVLYNIVLFVSIRDRIFLWFTLQLVFMSLYINAISGYGYVYIWPGFSAFQMVSVPVFSFCIIVTALQFMRQLLQTRQLSPILDRVLIAHVILAGAALAILVFWYGVGVQIGMAVVFSAMACMIFTALLGVKRGKRQASVFLAGFSSLVVGASLSMLTTANLVPPDLPLWLCAKGDYVGIMLQAAFFSFVLSSRVTTLRSERDSAEARGRFKQQFIATISHEMRTPLNAIIGFAESSLGMDSLQRIKETNRLVLGESERLLFQINQVLDLAKLEAGRIMVEAQPFGLAESLDYIRSVFSEPARRHGLELVVRTEGRLPPGLRGDRLRIEQVLRNLLDNAIKFTPKGQVGLTVVCWPVEAGMIRLNYTVSDTGIGIDDDKQKEIFEDFVQADASITRRYGGTGLGISIARRLVEAMGGQLELHSRRGIGTSFSFSLHLPVCELSETEQAALMEPAGDSAPEALAESGERKRWRILVVDDFEMNRQVVGVHLSRLPVDLEEADCGEKALALMETREYALVLLDLFMPGISGIEVVKKIRETHSAASLPVLGLTASNDQADLEESLAAGMNGIMVKPIKKSDLVLRLRELLPEME